MVVEIVLKALPFVIVFMSALMLTLILTPLVREMNRMLGMVDKPDPRRINKTPIPRGGGLALFAGVTVSYSIFIIATGLPPLQFPRVYWKLVTIAAGVVALGFVDDKFSLHPKVKLAGQLAAAVLCWWWVGLGLTEIFPSLPAWVDFLLTVFWITGAINALNLIDGLDGLASGIALIATLGMAGSLFIVQNPHAALFHFAFVGGLLGFLRYNYNPASVFLGDSGSMYIGFTLATMPLVSQEADSFLVSVGVPMLAMGVPIFDTSLAICRRSIRRVIRSREEPASGSDNVMIADADHLHHRILRSVGLNQRKTAWILYAMTAVAVAFGLIAMSVRSRTAGLWLLAVAVASFVVFKNMARIELYDVGRLLNSVARDNGIPMRRRIARLAMPIYLFFDIALLIGSYFLILRIEGSSAAPAEITSGLIVRVFVTFLMLVVARVYSTVWSRAMLSNYLRLAAACIFGSLASTVAVRFAPSMETSVIVGGTLSYALLSFVSLAALRVLRPAVRDLFYALDCSQLKGRKDVSRILVYGAGLRYRAFRRELVRSSASNKRMIVGILDDDIILRGQYIGGIRIEGTLQEAPEVINRLNVDTVVIACVVTDAWMKVVKNMLRPTGVKIRMFSLVESEVSL